MLKTRYEKKYLLNLEQYLSLKNHIAAVLPRDPYSRDGYYKIKSQYYDTPDFLFYEEKINGEWEHRKVRYRSYGESSETGIWEAKIKSAEAQLKYRTKSKEDLFHFLKRYKGLILKKSANVFYERLAFEGVMLENQMENRARVTFDKDIFVENSFSKVKLLEYELKSPQILMEIKTDQADLPSFLRDLLVGQGVNNCGLNLSDILAARGIP